MGKLLEGRGKSRGMQPRALRSRLAVDQERLSKSRHVFELAACIRDVECEMARDLDAIARLLDGCCEQVGNRQAPALRLGGIERKHPARDRSRHGERSERPA